MNKNYNVLLSQLQKRMNPDGYSDVRLFGESVDKELLTVGGRSALEYVRRSMQGVGDEYTKRSMDAGRTVIGHLKGVLTDVTYDFQGSVMTNTHIKGNSDIDLLTICGKFYYSDNTSIQRKFQTALANYELTSIQKYRLESNAKNADYQGDANADLRSIRLKSESKMVSVYDIVDISKAKCIQITNQNLHRDVDIVVASWHKTYEGIRDADIKKHSIRIYDKDWNAVGRIESPFVSIARINTRDSTVNGRLKKMIRFAKTLLYDSPDAEKIELSSFELNSICYHIDIANYHDKAFYDLVLVLARQLDKVVKDVDYRDSITSVDGSEYIFKGKPSKVESLRLLLREVEDVLTDLNLTLLSRYV